MCIAAAAAAAAIALTALLCSHVISVLVRNARAPRVHRSKADVPTAERFERLFFQAAVKDSSRLHVRLASGSSTEPKCSLSTAAGNPVQLATRLEMVVAAAIPECVCVYLSRVCHLLRTMSYGHCTVCAVPQRITSGEVPGRLIFRCKAFSAPSRTVNSTSGRVGRHSLFGLDET